MELIVEVPREFAPDLKDYLQEARIDYRVLVILKPGDWPVMISTAVTTLAAALYIIKTLYAWSKAKKREGVNVPITVVIDKRTRIDLNNVSPDEAKKILQNETSD